MSDERMGFLQWALGGAVALYGATAAAFMAATARASAHARAEIKRLEERVNDIEERRREDDDKIWSAITKQNEAQQVFQGQILRDLARVATRDDLRDHENRMTALLRGGAKQNSE